MNKQLSLWDDPVLEYPLSHFHTLKPETLIKVDGDVVIYWNAFTLEESNRFFKELLKEVSWQQDFIKFRGKFIPLPRFTAWYGEQNKLYKYSGIQMSSKPWTPTLLLIKNRIESISKTEFNSVLLNLYRHGKDSVAWHSDDESELGKNPVIGSVSLGETRRFVLKHRYKPDIEKVTIDLTHGSFLLMKGETQHFWQHQVPKTQRVVKERINLTFRVIQ